jgi:hypothetical protein
MGVPLKTENEENPGRACKRPVAKAGGESSEALRELILNGPTPESFRPPHRLLTLNTVMWLLRCSVLRGTPMPGIGNHDFKKLKGHENLFHGGASQKAW